jgi:hypothetical protein
MLFDLRGRGRRRTVRMIYVGLALLMGVGLVGFGIGAGTGGGGLLTAANNPEGANSASFASQIKKYRKLTQQQPSNVSAWENLTKALLHESGSETYVNNSTGAVTSKGKELFNQASQAWSGYLALNPPKPNPELAQLMLTVYGTQGLNQPAKAVEVLQIAVVARPVAALFSQLALYAYKANNPRVGDLASAKAVSLAPAAQRIRLKNELQELKKNPSGEKTYTTTTNGKTFTGKLNSKGELKATEAHTLTAPAGTSSTTKKK